jgi:flavin reductase (DIM6/NTAB) family NADH-FMN oxidoreductase RutF
MDDQDVRDAFARVPGAVALVATRDASGFRGATATSFTAVSLEPPLVLVCLDRHSATRDAIEETGAFTVSVLGRGQEFLADRFAGQAPAVEPTWREVPHRLGESGLPLVDGAAGWFQCRLESHQAAGDHELLIGRITAVERGPGDPLLHWERGYWALTR